MAELAGSIDELERNLFEGSTRSLREEGLAEGEDTLLGTNTAALDHDEIILDHTVVRETTHGVDALGSQVEFSATGLVVSAVADAVDLLVHFSAVVETVLTSTGTGETNVGRVPGTDTGNLAQTLVGLARQAASAPTSGDTLETVTLGNTNDVNVLVLFEDASNSDFLFEVSKGPVDLLFNGTTVELDFHQVSLLLADGGLADLSVSQDTDDSGVLLQLFQGSSDGSTTFSSVLGSVLGEGELLGLLPVLVEAALDIISQVFSKDSGDSAQTTRSGNVTNDTADNHGRTFNDGDGFQDFLLVHLGARAIEVADNVAHASLEAHEGSQVDRLAAVITREGLDLTLVALATLTGQETKRTVAGSFEFTMRLEEEKTGRKKDVCKFWFALEYFRWN